MEDGHALRTFDEMTSVRHPFRIFKIQICTLFDPLDLRTVRRAMRLSLIRYT